MTIPGRSKYGARRTVVDGITFASAKEARRWGDLTLLARGGQITDLVRQPRFPIEVGGVVVCTYVADASYTEKGVRVVEDVKGGQATKTPLYRLKKKLLRATWGLDIREV